MNTTKNLALRKPLLISAWLLAMQGATYAQNPIVQTQLTTDPAPLVVGDDRGRTPKTGHHQSFPQTQNCCRQRYESRRCQPFAQNSLKQRRS